MADRDYWYQLRSTYHSLTSTYSAGGLYVSCGIRSLGLLRFMRDRPFFPVM
jgi:hypothetical protein